MFKTENFNGYITLDGIDIEDVLAWLEKQGEQKPAEWSEEDETKIKSIIALIKSSALCTMDGNKGIIDESIKYLKSLKDRYAWTPSDEQMKALNNIIVNGHMFYSRQERELMNLYNDLKKLIKE